MSEFQAPFNSQHPSIKYSTLHFGCSKYSFCLTYGQNWLEIKATLQGSDKCSTINTLNYILSAFDIEPNSSNAEEPQWNGTEQEMQKWVDLAQSLFVDKQFLQSLERELDKDRQEGEWEAD
jgi:hypothetical protein